MSSWPDTDHALPERTGRPRPSGARFMLLCLALLVVGGLTALLVPALERRLATTRDSYRLWGQGVPLDLLQTLPRGARERIFQRLQRELLVTRQPGQDGAREAALWQLVAPCASGPCPKARRRLQQASVSARLQHDQRFSGTALVLLGVALALLALGVLALGQSRGVPRLALGLGLVMGVCSLSLQVRQLSVQQGQARQAVELGRQVVRVRLSLGQPGPRLAAELDRARQLIPGLDSVPAAERQRLDRALGRCSRALQPTPARKRRAALNTRAVDCPRVLVPLARARNATLAPLRGSTLRGHAVRWLSLTAGLLLLLAPLFENLRRR